MSYIENINIVQPLDKFNNVQSASPTNRFDIEALYDLSTEIMDSPSNGGGSISHDTNGRHVDLAINNTTSGTYQYYIGHYDVPYTPGNAQLIDITGVLDLADIGGGTPQVVLRSKVSGTITEEVYNFGDWDYQPSGLNWNYSHIFAFDFQSLKVGTIDFYMARQGEIPVMVKRINNDNVRNTGYWQRATLPILSRIINDTTYTYMELGYGDDENAIVFRYRMAANASATMRFICATVKSYGGEKIQEISGYQRSISNGTTAVTVSTTEVPILSIRVSSLFNSITNRGLYLPNGYTVNGDNPLFYRILYRPTLTGASFAPVNTTYSGMEYDVSASAVSGGIEIDADYISTGRNTLSKAGGLLGKTIMSLGRSGTSDILSIVGTRDSSSNVAAKASIKWGEIR